MNAEDTVKSVGAVVVLTGVAWLSDVIGLALSALQQALFSAIAGFLGTGVGAVVAAGVGLGAWLVDKLGGTNIVEYTQGILGAVFGLQMLISLLTLCVFYAVFMVSPKESFSTGDYLAAASVFLAESVPVLCGFTLWGGFAAWLKREEISDAVGKFSSAAGLSEVSGGGKKGILSKAMKVIKK